MLLKGILVLPSAATSKRSSAPPALQQVANRPIICRALEEMRRAGVGEATIVVPDAVASELRACVADEGPPEIDTRFLSYGRDELLAAVLDQTAALVGEHPCIVQLADGLLAQPLAPLVELLGADTPDLAVLIHQGAGQSERLGLATRRLLRLAEAEPEKSALGLAGVCLFGAGALRHVRAAKWCPGPDVELVAVAERLVAVGGRLHVAEVRGWQRYAGEARDLLQMNHFMLDALAPDVVPPNSEGSRIEGRVMIHPTATIKSSVIVGPAIVGPRARLVDAYIGPYTSIGADVRIEGAEIERSIILAGASILHVGGRLVASVVGRDARIFRDFSLPRAIRLNVGDGVEVALC